MSQVEATYCPCDPPRDLGYEANYSGNMVHCFLYGSTKVTFPDGFTVWTPHAAIKGTISAEPLNLDETDFAGTSRRDMMIENARRVREQSQRPVEPPADRQMRPTGCSCHEGVPIHPVDYAVARAWRNRVDDDGFALKSGLEDQIADATGLSWSRVTAALDRFHITRSYRGNR